MELKSHQESDGDRSPAPNKHGLVPARKSAVGLIEGVPQGHTASAVDFEVYPLAHEAVT